jgi:AcrR family transcriptional regulator
MPKLWTDTVQAHRQAVREAILEATVAVVADHGPASVTMSQIAAHTGIGRATLYKYFPDVHAVLRAWHDRQVAAHIAELSALRDQHSHPAHRLEAVLAAYARITQQQRHSGELAAALHQGEHVAQTRQQLHELVRDLVAEAASNGTVRDDVPADELATYCLHALAAASSATSQATIDRLVNLTLDSLRAPSSPA